MPIGISPLVDYSFKKLFGSQPDIAILIHFLNAVLVGQPKIVSARIVNPAQGKAFAADKFSILDVLAIDELGRTFLIEMQRPSISICVLAGGMFSTAPKLHLDFRLREKSHPLTLTEDIQIHILQLRYLQITAETVYNASGIERWAWFLCNADTLTLEDIPRLFPDPEFVEAAGILAMIAQTQEELIAYHARLKPSATNPAEFCRPNWKADRKRSNRPKPWQQSGKPAALHSVKLVASHSVKLEVKRAASFVVRSVCCSGC